LITGSAILKTKILPSLEGVESFTLPEQSTKAPWGIWPSTKRIAFPEYELVAPDESEQNQPVFFRRQVLQSSTICNPYGVFICVASS
jgi:hypothetical protein